MSTTFTTGLGTALSDAVNAATGLLTSNVGVLLAIPGAFLVWGVIKRAISRAK